MAVRKNPRGASAKIESLRREASACRDCPLFANATQTVFGEGDARARKGRPGEEAAWRQFVSDLETAARYVKD